jgi:hypothetical protein
VWVSSHLKALNRQFRVGRQEDAHELLIHLIEALHSNCLRVRRSGRGAGLGVSTGATRSDHH